MPGSPFKTEMGVSIVKSDPLGRFIFVGENRAVRRARDTNCADEPSILAVNRIDPESGTLTQVESVILSGSCVADIAVDPSGKHLYVGVKNIAISGGSIQGFSISSDGTLTELASSPLIVEDLPMSLAMHPSGKFIFAATPEISILDRNTSTGLLTVRAVFSTPKRQLALNQAGTLLFASERDTTEISQFRLDVSGNVIAEDRQVMSMPPGIAANLFVAVVRPR